MKSIFLEVKTLEVNWIMCAFAQSSQGKKKKIIPTWLVGSEFWQTSFSQKFINT